MNEEIGKKDASVVACEKEIENKRKAENLSKLHFCKDCKHYDKKTEREFRRKVGKKNEKGDRTEIVELRAMCKNSRAKSFAHLVMAENSRRRCSSWEKSTHGALQIRKR